MKNTKYTLFLLLALAACSGIEEEVIPQDDIIKLTVLDQADGIEISEPLVGDGKTTIHLVAKIPAKTKEDWRDITFKTSIGTIIESGNGEYVVKANSEGYAYADVKLPLSNGDMVLSAHVKAGTVPLRSDPKTIKLTRINTDEVLTFEVLSADGSSQPFEILADGNTILLLKAKVLIDQDNLRIVTFESGDATFLQGNPEIPINGEQEATLELKMPTSTNPLFLTATVGQNPPYTLEETIIPSRAYPDSLFLEPEMLRMGLGDQNSIDIFLTRAQGTVSEEHTATYDTYQVENGNRVPVGRLTGVQDAKSDTGGKLSVKFHTDTNDIDTLKSVFLEVITTKNLSGNTISKTLEIEMN